MPLSETADDTRTQLLGCGKQEGSGCGEGREGMKGLASEGGQKPRLKKENDKHKQRK